MTAAAAVAAVLVTRWLLSRWGGVYSVSLAHHLLESRLKFLCFPALICYDRRLVCSYCPSPAPVEHLQLLPTYTRRCSVSAASRGRGQSILSKPDFNLTVIQLAFTRPLDLVHARSHRLFSLVEALASWRLEHLFHLQLIHVQMWLRLGLSNSTAANKNAELISEQQHVGAPAIKTFSFICDVICDVTGGLLMGPRTD